MPARSAHHVPQGDGQAGRPASPAPVQALLPIRTVVLTVRAHEHLLPHGHRACPRQLALVGIEGRTVAEEAARPVRRPHDPEDSPWGDSAPRYPAGDASGVSPAKRSVSTARSTMTLFSA
jgi:hypothetical protein